MRQPNPGFAVAQVPCTCGELVQGYLDGEPFLVSCPIERYSRVAVTLGARATGTAGPKAMRGAEAALRTTGFEGPFSVHAECPLPPSKGFGTSTADVVGAIVAAGAAAGARPDPWEVARLAASVEPSDSTMFPGLAAINHRTGRNAILLGAAPALRVVVLEFRGTVDTLEYNSTLDVKYLRANESHYAETLRLLRHGLETGRLELVGCAATMSARLNQRLLPKPGLEDAIRLAGEYEALGVCAAHSGTILGVLFPPGEGEPAADLARAARGRVKAIERIWITRMVGGGADLLAGTAPATAYDFARN